MPHVVAIIPARYGSSRFPGKPLATIKGQPMVAWVVQRCQQVPLFNQVVVATDDERIAQAAEHVGAKVVMTRPDHPSGSDRVWEAASQLPDADIIVNVQGDEPFIDPKELKQLTQIMLLPDSAIDVATLVCPITDPEEFNNPNVVKAVLAANNKVLYFSRAPIPYDREGLGASPVLGYRHIGVYAYTRNALQQFVGFAPTDLEKTECLEQLRGMHYGLNYAALLVPNAPMGVDTPEDLQRLEDEGFLQTGLTKSTSSLTTGGSYTP